VSAAASRGRVLRRPGGSPAAVAGAVFLLALAAAAVCAGSLSPYDPLVPSGAPVGGPRAGHYLGTNELGQDLLSVWLYGARVSLTIGFATAVLSTVAAGVAGLLSAVWRFAQAPVLAVADLLLAIPHLPVLVLIVAVLGPGMWHVVAALAFLGWPAYARVVRAQALSALQRGYVDAARTLGASKARILRTCLLPEILPLLWTKFLLTVRWAILSEAALALMGLGDPSRASWGTMLNSAFAYPLLFIGKAWLWWPLPPALAIAAVTLSLSAIGRDFETWLNPASSSAGDIT
jgi:peptide/nickel transport system permease protein